MNNVIIATEVCIIDLYGCSFTKDRETYLVNFYHHNIQP